jgi:hypothetical protein
MNSVVVRCLAAGRRFLWGVVRLMVHRSWQQPCKQVCSSLGIIALHCCCHVVVLLLLLPRSSTTADVPLMCGSPPQLLLQLLPPEGCLL